MQTGEGTRAGKGAAERRRAWRDGLLIVASALLAVGAVVLGLPPSPTLIVFLGAAFYVLRLRGRHASRVLALEQARLKTIIDGTGVGTWDSDITRRRIHVDEHWAAMLGRRHEQMSPLSLEGWNELLHPDDVAPAQAAIADCFAVPGRVFEVDLRLRHAAGHWVWVAARGNVIERDAQQRPLRMAGTHVNISRRKAAELALKDSENRFRSLFELSPVGIALTDLQSGRFLQINNALVTPTLYSRDELLALSSADITPAEFADTAQQLGMLEDTARFGPYEKEFIRKDGSRYPVLLSGIRMVDADGRAVIWSIVQDISRRKAMETALTAAARRDKLTGLANRSVFMEALQRAVTRVRDGEQARFAVLFLDFDHFKLVNDTLGHEAGDELLRQIAARLRASLRNVDLISEAANDNLVARFGGDEFLVLINDLDVDADTTRVAERLLGSLAPAYSIHGREVHSTASIGIVTSDRGFESAEAIVRNADVAMYEAKRSGRACSVLFNEAMHTRLTRHVTVETSLRKALGTSQLSLAFQPIVCLATGIAVSVEALVRWHHPVLGPVSPAEFIPVAEDSGLIVPLGYWVLREACAALVRWREEDPQGAPDSVSVNVSRAELALGERFLDRVRETLETTGLAADRLVLEVTEREVMRDPVASQALMHDLRSMGVRLAMDDFGTGTSSLACLRDYPFDIIKIDRSFVSNLAENPDVLAVIHATVTLVENLGKRSVAEGVETAAQVAILQSLGCRYAQGYFFSPALPLEQHLQAALARQGPRQQPVRAAG